MWVTTKGRYGLRAMMALARFHDGDPVQMSFLSEELKISRKYLHALLSQLKEAELVVSYRGATGGFSLAKSPDDINVADLMRALEDSEVLVACVRDESYCDRYDRCAAKELWGDLGKVISDHLSGITLQELSTRQSELIE